MNTNDTMKSFLELRNVRIERNLAMLINQDEIFNNAENFEYDTKTFNCGPNTLILFDCVDYNSAFMHEWYLLLHQSGEITSKFNVEYVESTPDVKKFIKRWHSDINKIPVEDYPDKKYEIFMIAIVDGIIYTKSDDFDIINQNTMLDIVEIYNATVTVQQ